MRIACATKTEVLRDKTKISASASGERIHPRNLTPGGWPATEAPPALLGSPATPSLNQKPKVRFRSLSLFLIEPRGGVALPPHAPPAITRCTVHQCPPASSAVAKLPRYSILPPDRASTPPGKAWACRAWRGTRRSSPSCCQLAMTHEQRQRASAPSPLHLRLLHGSLRLYFQQNPYEHDNGHADVHRESTHRAVSERYRSWGYAHAIRVHDVICHRVSVLLKVHVRIQLPGRGSRSDQLLQPMCLILDAVVLIHRDLWPHACIRMRHRMRPGCARQ